MVFKYLSRSNADNHHLSKHMHLTVINKGRMINCRFDRLFKLVIQYIVSVAIVSFVTSEFIRHHRGDVQLQFKPCVAPCDPLLGHVQETYFSSSTGKMTLTEDFLIIFHGR